MVDKVYKTDLPRLRDALHNLKEEFSSLNTKTDWVSLRIEPLISHIETLEMLLHSPDFTQEFKRLRKGVAMFHSDLVYLRTNVKELEKVLQSEKR